MSTEEDLRRLTHRVDELPGPVADGLHHLVTAPFIGGAANYQALHAAGEENGVWLVPIALGDRHIRVRRIVALVATAGAGHAFGLSLHVRRFTVRNRASPSASAGEPVALARTLWVAKKTALAGDPDGHRLQYDTGDGAEILLDGTRGQFYVGIQSDHADCLWFCPAGPVDSPQGALKTTPAGPAFGSVPAELVVSGRLRYLPAIALWSTLGRKLFEGPGD